jgi:hypothetical protein
VGVYPNAVAPSTAPQKPTAASDGMAAQTAGKVVKRTK